MDKNKDQKQDQIALIKQYLENAQANLALVQNLVNKLSPDDFNKQIFGKAENISNESLGKNSKIVEGVFDGQNMIGPDGKVYTIPPNYASKSKLVEGDILKLTIMPDGSFLYKQIGPVERKRIVGNLVQDNETKEFKVLANGRSYKVILASVTYFKGEVGDQAVILVPKDQDSKWAAVENIIKEGQSLDLGDDIKLENGLDMELSSGDEFTLDNGSNMEITGADQDQDK